MNDIIKPEYNSKYEYMIGTGGTLDYIVVAHVGPLTFGIKPVVEMANSLQVFIGFRVRLHANTQEVKTEVPDVKLYLSENPSLFTFEKISEKRASAMTGAKYPIPFGMTADQLLAKLKEQNFIGSMIDHLSGFFAIEVPLDAITEFLMPKLTSSLVQLETRFGEMEKPEYYDEALAKLLSQDTGSEE